MGLPIHNKKQTYHCPPITSIHKSTKPSLKIFIDYFSVPTTRLLSLYYSSTALFEKEREWTGEWMSEREIFFFIEWVKTNVKEREGEQVKKIKRRPDIPPGTQRLPNTPHSAEFASTALGPNWLPGLNLNLPSRPQTPTVCTGAREETEVAWECKLCTRVRERGSSGMYLANLR